MKRTLLSIIIPLYNKEKYISECLESIVNCKYDVEIIVIDDGSTDNSANIVEDFIRKYYMKNIKLLKQKNKGPSSARNEGIRFSNSEYTLFLDADDYFNSKSLDYLIDLAKKYNADLIEFDFCNSKIDICQPKIVYKYNSRIKLLKQLLNKKKIKSVVWGTLFKTEICKEIAFLENMKWGEDSCYKLDYILNCNSGIYVQAPYYVNRILFDNTLSRQKISHEMIKSVISYIDYYEYKLKGIKDINRDLNNRLFKTCVSYIRLCKKIDKNEYTKEILLLKSKCKNYIKKIKMDSYKYLIFYMFLILFDKNRSNDTLEL